MSVKDLIVKCHVLQMVLWYLSDMAVADTDICISVGDSAILTCALEVQFPSWNSPSGRTLTYQGYPAINPHLEDLSNRMSWASDNRSLIISNTKMTDGGSYACVAAGHGHYYIRLHVQASNMRVFASVGSNATLQFDISSRLLTGKTYLVLDSTGTHRVQFLKYSGSIMDLETLRLTFTSNISAGHLRFRIDNVQTEDSGVYKLVEDIDVGTTIMCNTVYITGNLSVSILSANKSPSAGESVILRCSSNSSTIPADLPLIYTWHVDGATNPSDSRYVYSTSRDILTISRIQTSDGDKMFTCMAQEQGSNISSSISKQFRVDVHYVPIVVIHVSPHYVTECTDRLTLTCDVSSNPISNITWYKGKQVLSSTGGGNMKVFSISNVNRSASGQYRCEASNGYRGNIQTTVNITVSYHPDVSVITTNVTTQDSSVDIECSPFGVPDQYIFSPWTHKWGINGPLLDHPDLGNSRVLTLSDLTYEHSGVYTCKVTNGVDCSMNQGAGSGHSYLMVKAPPVLLNPTSGERNERIRLVADINSRVTFNVTIWSNTAGTTVQCYRSINGVRIAPSVGGVTLTTVPVELPVLSTSVSTTGTLATLSLEIEKEDDYGLYDVVISNHVGKGEVLLLRIQPTGPPEVPVLHSIKAMNHMILVVWSAGFDGGLDQRIVIQTSTDNEHWKNKTTMSLGTGEDLKIHVTELQDLVPSTLHYIRLFAYNDKGRHAGFSRIVNCTTNAVAADPESSKVDPGVIAGASAGVLLFVVIIGLGYYMLKSYRCIKQHTGEAFLMTERKYDDVITSTSTDHDLTASVETGDNMARQEQPNNLKALLTQFNLSMCTQNFAREVNVIRLDNIIDKTSWTPVRITSETQRQ